MMMNEDEEAAAYLADRIQNLSDEALEKAIQLSTFQDQIVMRDIFLLEQYNRHEAAKTTGK
jgi:hypothetical protein